MACGTFAKYIASHDCARGGVIVDVWTSDPRRLEEDEKTAMVHTAVRLPDGRFLDSEGVRTFEALCRDFGMRHTLSEFRPARHPEPDTVAKDGVLLRRLADCLGWQDGAPDADDIETASGSWSKARTDFERMGGMNGRAADMLSKCILKARKAARAEAAPSPGLG